LDIHSIEERPKGGPQPSCFWPHWLEDLILDKYKRTVHRTLVKHTIRHSMLAQLLLNILKELLKLMQKLGQTLMILSLLMSDVRK